MKLSHQPVTIKAAQAFVDEHHRHNKAPRGARFAVRAIFEGETVGIVIVGRPVARRLDDGMTCEVLRCCVRDGAPRNAPSYLYGIARRVWQSWGGSRIITYNLATESGDSLRAAGFVAVAKVKPDSSGWGRSSRPRDNAEIYQTPKVRWELDLRGGHDGRLAPRKAAAE